MKYMLVAGEASGDLHGSRLIKELKEQDPEASFCIIGGDKMAEAAGIDPEIHYRELNYMGFSEVIRHLPAILGNLRKAKGIMQQFRPDAMILIDYPGFNLRLAKASYNAGIKTVYYISPKVWAWKTGRVKKIRKYVDLLLSILPFEPKFYKEHSFSSLEYVGNPSVEEIDYALGHLMPKKHFVERQGIKDERPIIALLPGSRKGEIRCNLPVMIEAAKRYKDFQYVVAAAPSIPEKFYREVAGDPGIPLVFGATVPLLKYSSAAIVTSGTATLETALVGTPQVVCYRSNGSKLTYKIMRRIVKGKYVSLPNLIIGNKVLPELLLHECTPVNISRELSPLLQPSPDRDNQIQGYRLMRRRLGNSIAPAVAAENIIGLLQAS